jgi:Skp family chaperone for outer membrane proteins
MLSTKPVLPKFLKTLLITSMAFGSVAAYASHHQEGEKKIGDVKEMKAKHSMKADKMHKEHDAKHSTTDEAAKDMDDAKKDMAEIEVETVTEE